MSMSPAASTALPLLAMRLARRARSMPAMPMAASKCADGRGNEADEQGHQRRHVRAQALHRFR